MSDLNHPAFGVWEVFAATFPGRPSSVPVPVIFHPDDEPDNPEEGPQCFGCFEGYVDDIALYLTRVHFHARQQPYMFRRAPEGTLPQDLPEASLAADDECVVEVELEGGHWLSLSPEKIQGFFQGQPVTADKAPNGTGVRISQVGTDAGKVHAERKTALELIFAKLTKGEIQTLVEHGLNQYTY